MAKKNDLNEEDINTFREAVRNVKRIITDNKITPNNKPLKLPRPKPRIDDDDLPTDSFSDFESLEAVGSDDILEYSRPGLQHKMLRKMRSGQYNVEAILDLHGMTVEQARESLNSFLIYCSQEGIRHVLMIHGKGRSTSKPILKNKLNHWLRQTDQVIAFCTATAKNGRGGALYVLLKNQKEER